MASARLRATSMTAVALQTRGNSPLSDEPVIELVPRREAAPLGPEIGCQGDRCSKVPITTGERGRRLGAPRSRLHGCSCAILCGAARAARIPLARGHNNSARKYTVGPAILDCSADGCGTTVRKSPER